MIPNIIFYTWLGSEEPVYLQKNKQSWIKHNPDFKIININGNNKYFDLNYELFNCKWFNAVYERKLWAFVSDYMRIKTILDHGGFYLDSDITVIKPLYRFQKHEFFAGYENKYLINMAIFGSILGHEILRMIYDFYQNEIWSSTLYTIPEIMTLVFRRVYGEKSRSKNYAREIIQISGVAIYPPSYFYPFPYKGHYSPQCIGKETYAIHWWHNSWTKEDDRRWLSSKHLVHLCPEFMNVSVDFYLAHTQPISICVLRIFNKEFFGIFRQGRFRVVKLFSLPILAIERLGKKTVFYIFMKIVISIN